MYESNICEVINFDCIFFFKRIVGATCGSEVVRLPPMLKVRGSTLGHVGRDADFDHQYVSPVTRARRQGFSPGTPASSPSSLEISSANYKTSNTMYMRI